MTRGTIHHVYANRSNAGDWLSARGVQMLLGDAPIEEHLCDEPFVPETLRSLSTLQRTDIVVVGGGGLLMDYFVPFWEGLLDLDVRLCVWGIGVVDLKREPTLPPPRLLRRIAERSELTVVRDARTAEMLGGSDVTVSPCPSLVAVPAAPPAPLGLLHVANMTTVGEQEFMQMRIAGEAWAGATSRVFRETNNRHHADDAGLESVLALYRRSDVVLSSALHGCLIAIAMGRPVVAVSGDYKIDEMMTDAGLAHWLLGQEQIADVPSCLVDVLAHQAMPVAYVERALVEGRTVADRVRSLVDLDDRSGPTAAEVRRVNRRARC